jgi:hypothetical protein
MPARGRASWVAMLAAAAATSYVPTLHALDDACLSAPVDGQKLRRADKLVDAHDKFALCAQRKCPARIVQECTRWLHEVDDITPSIVAAARDSQGGDLLDVRVSVDGQPMADMSARAMVLDPGPHKLVFRRVGSADIEQEVLLHEGEKNRAITATFKTKELPPPPPPPVLERPIPLVVWILGGVAAVGGVTFIALGAAGVSERGSDCSPAGCTQAQKSSIESKFYVGDASLGIGVIALVTGGVFFFTRPTLERPAAAFLQVRPILGGGPGGGVVGLGGSF